MLHAPRLLFALALAGALSAQNDGKIRPGPWPTPAKVPPGWVVYNTKNYHVQSQVGMDKGKRLGDHMEVMNVTYRKMFKPDKGGEKQQTIKLFKDEQGFQMYGQVPGAAAYYDYGEREMVCYDTGKWSDEEKPAGPVTGPESRLDRLNRRSSRFEDMMTMDLLGCAAHEGWHQYYHWYVVSQVELPSWINEGMGDYFYTAAPKRGKGGKMRPVELGRMNDGRLWVLQAAKRQDQMEPLEKFLGMLQDDYYSNPSICYAQGWAFCQFLLHGEKGKYSKLVPNYIRGLRDDTNWKAVHTKVFKGLDLSKMETEFKAFIDTMKTADGFDPEKPEGEEPPPAGAPAPAPAEPPKEPGGGTPANGGK